MYATALYMLNAHLTSLTCCLSAISLVIDYFVLDSLPNVDFLSFSNWPVLSNKALGVNLTTRFSEIVSVTAVIDFRVIDFSRTSSFDMRFFFPFFFFKTVLVY